MSEHVFVNAGTDLSQYLEAPDPALIVKPAEFWGDEFYAEVGKSEELVGGDLLPWNSLESKFRLRKQELTIWGGQSGAGKSWVTNQVMLGLAHQNKKSMVQSFEMKAMQTLQRMACQFYKRNSFSQLSMADAKEFMRFIKGRIWIYNQMGKVQAPVLMAVNRWAKDTLDIDHSWIDSLMMLTKGSEDLQGQKDICQSLQDLGKDLNIGVHLVAHTKKPQHGQKKSGKFDISGASEIVNLGDNIIMIDNANVDGDIPPEVGMPDIWIRVVKQRHREFKGSVGFWKINDTFCLSDSKSRTDPDRGVI